MRVDSFADVIRLVNIVFSLALIVMVLIGQRRTLALDIARLALMSWGFAAGYASYSLSGVDANWRRPALTFLSLCLSLSGVVLIRIDRKRGVPDASTGLPEPYAPASQPPVTDGPDGTREP